MDDLQFGTRDKRGDFRPNEKLGFAPFFTKPFDLAAMGGWLKSYLFGWNLLFFVSALVCYFFVLPAPEVMANLEWGWTLKLFAVNLASIALFYGILEVRYYRQQAQERRFKYNGKFPSEQPSDVFWFKSQNMDNAIRSLLITVPLGTAVEVISLWLMSAGYVPGITFATNPVWFVILVLIIPIVHEAHFFFIHRAIHMEPLYKWIHSVHHNSVNPSPWSSLSMHPIEGTLYFASVFWQLIMFSNPFLVVFQWNLAGFGAVVGHLGFDKLEVGENKAVDSHAYAHYLHHKHFEVNYCDDGVLPWDRWFGTFHDGSTESETRMRERFRRKKERVAAKLAKNNPTPTAAE